MRHLISVSLAVALLLAVAPLGMGVMQRLPLGRGAAGGSELTCSVKASCDVGEVAVFRMSALTNAHAQTPDYAAYPKTICCSGPAGLSTSCSGSYDTVLTLSAADNAHVASDGSYGTQVCLSASAGVDCQYGPSCSTGYACLATISDTTNAHVADCDGSGDYGTKVCCTAESGPVCTPPFTPIVPGDNDCDAAPDKAEVGPDPTQCGTRDPGDPWDFYDVPVPTLHVGGSMDNRNGAVTLIDDVLGVIEYSGTIDEGPPTGAGRDYDDDNDGDGYDDGIAYDRDVGAPWPELGADKSHSGPPDGAVTLFDDVLLVLDQSGHGPCPGS